MSKPVFIVGSPRSGSTLLRMILNAHSQFSMPHECPVIYYILRHYERPTVPVTDLAAFVDDLIHIPRFTMVFNLDRQSILAGLQLCSDRSPPALLGSIYRLSQGYLAQDIHIRWGDKYIGLGEFIPELADYFREAQFIHIVRDPIDSVASIKNYFNIYPSLSGRVYLCQHTVGAALLWRRLTYASANYKQQLGSNRYINIRYEDLVSEPVRVCEQICAFLRIDYESAMLEYYKHAEEKQVLPVDSFEKLHQNTAKPIIKSRVGYGKKQLSSRDIELVKHICGDLMEIYAYSCNYKGRSHVVMIFAYVLIYYIVRLPYYLWFKMKDVARSILKRSGLRLHRARS